ncbi:MAG: hypothetical protein RL748_1008 [Pseudomonadota bacterium]|jgi:hypothetical protein
MVTRQSSTQVLGSQWGSLNAHLIARFFPVKRKDQGTGWEQDSRRAVSVAQGYQVDNGLEVHAPISDGNLDMTLNWHSPFEGAGADAKAPALSAQLQSGALTPILQAFQGLFGVSNSNPAALSANDFLESAFGRTGITKLNSTQVFNGMPAVRFSVTAHFRAFENAIDEVQAPIRALENWAVPQFLSEKGLIAGAISSTAKGIETLFPSKSPQLIGMRYADMLLMPLVIERVSRPFTGPRTDNGKLAACSVQLDLATLAAFDQRDIARMYQ